MEAVAASKMRRAQDATLASREYANKAREVMAYLASQPATQAGSMPLLEQRPVEKIGLVLITPDRGLAGALVSNVIRTAVDFIKSQDVPVTIISVGRKGTQFMARYNYPLHATFREIPDLPSTVDLAPVARVAVDDFSDGAFDQVFLCYTDFVNTLRQAPVVRQMLPLQPPEAEEVTKVDYEFEPDPQTILNEILPRFTLLQIYQAILEAQASEHSARMVAMRSATDNAAELAEDLTLTYNKARQTAITMEILDIAGGAEALVKARAASS